MKKSLEELNGITFGLEEHQFLRKSINLKQIGPKERRVTNDIMYKISKAIVNEALAVKSIK